MSKIYVTLGVLALAASAWAAAGTYDDLAGKRTDSDFWKPTRRALVAVDRENSDAKPIDTCSRVSVASDELATFDSRNGSFRFTGTLTVRTGQPGGFTIIVR